MSLFTQSKQTYSLRILLLLIGLLSFNIARAQTTSYWEGDYNTNWHDYRNWSAGVPNASTNAIIGDARYFPGGQGRSFPTVSQAAEARTLTLGGPNAGDAGMLTIRSTGYITFNSDVYIYPNGTMLNSGTDIRVGGNWTNNGSYNEEIRYTYDRWGYVNSTYYPAIDFSGAGKSIGGTAANTFNYATISGDVTLTAGLTIKPLGTTLSKFWVKGTLDPGLNRVSFTATPADGFVVDAGATIKVKATTFTGNYALHPTVMYTTSTVDYAAPGGTQTVFARTYGILKISGGGIKQLEADTYISDLYAGTQLLVEAGTLDLKAFSLNRAGAASPVTGGTLTVANGAFLNIGGTGTFPTGYATRDLGSTSTVTYNGANQIVSNQAYGNLTLSGTGTKTMPAATMTIAGKLSGAGSASFEAKGAININGDVELSGSSVFTGGSFTHTVGGNWTDNATFAGAGSTVVLNGAGKKINRTATGAASFNNLTISGSGLNITAAVLNIGGNLSITGSGTLSQVNSGTITMTGAGRSISGSGFTFQNLVFNGSTSTAATFEVQGNLTVNATRSFNATAGTINMTGTGKNITSNGTLSLFGVRVNGTISTASSFQVKSDFAGAGRLTASAGAVNFTGSSTYGGTHNFFDVSVSGSVLRMAATANLGIGGSFHISTGAYFDAISNKPNTVTFDGSIAQSVPGLTYHNLAFANTGAKSAAGAFTTNGYMSIGSGATLHAGAHSHTINGDWTNSGTFHHNNGSITLAGVANTYITGQTTFNTLTLNKAAATNTVTQNTDITTAHLNMNSGLLMTEENKINLTNDRSGNSWVVGTIRRIHPIAPNTAYSFNGPLVKATFGTVSGVSDISMRLNSGTVTGFPSGTAINSDFTISIPSGSYADATLQLQYHDNGLNGNNEDGLQLYRYANGAWDAKGKYRNSSTEDWVNQNALADISGRWTLSAAVSTLRWKGSNSTAWELASNWENLINNVPSPASSAPVEADVVVLGDVQPVNQPTITSAVKIKGLQFQGVAPITLTLGAGGYLDVAGNMAATGADAVPGANVQHIVNVEAQTLTVGGNLIMNDGSAGNSLYLNMSTGTTSVSGDLDHAGNGIISLGSGTFRLKGDYHMTAFASVYALQKGNGTFIYEGSNSQTIGIVYYNNLTIDKPAGIATLLAPAEGWVAGDITVNNGTFSIPGGSYILEKNVIQNGGVLEVGSSTITIMGDWVMNSGTFEANTSNFILQGDNLIVKSPLTLNNLTIDKQPGTTLLLTGNAVINNMLEIQSGTLDMGINTLNRSAAGGRFIMGDTATLLLSASNFPANFNNVLLSPLSTVKYVGTGEQSIAAVKYGNLEMANGGSVAKKLSGNITVTGDLKVNNGASVNADEKIVTLSGNFYHDGAFSPGAYNPSSPPNGGLVLATTGGVQKLITGKDLTVNNISIQPYSNYKLLTNLYVNGNIELAGNEKVYIDTVATEKFFDMKNNGYFNSATSNVTVAGDFTNAGILTGAGTRTFAGSRLQTILLNAPIVTGDEGAPTIVFDGSIPPVFNSKAAPLFASVYINNTGGIRTSVDWMIKGMMYVGTGASFDGGPYTHTIQTGIHNTGTILSAGTLNFEPENLGQGLTTYPLYFGANASSFQSTGTLRISGAEKVALAGAVPATLGNLTIANKHTDGVVTPANTTWNLKGNLQVLDGALLKAGAGSTYNIDGNITDNGNLDGSEGNFTLTNAIGLAHDPVTVATINGTGNTIMGNLTIDTGAAVEINESISILGDLVYKGTDLNTAGAEISFTGQGPSAIVASDGSLSMDNIRVSKSTPEVTVTLQADITDTKKVYVEKGSLDMGSYSITRAITTQAESEEDLSRLIVADNAYLKVGGTGTIPQLEAFELGEASTVAYYGSNQRIGSVQYGNLSIQNAGIKTFETGTAKIAGTFTKAPEATVLTPDTIVYNGTGNQTVAAINYNYLTLSTGGVKVFGTGTVGIAQAVTLTDGAGIEVLANTTTVDYNGATDQEVLPTNYYSLKLSNSGTKHFAATTGIANEFTITGTAAADLQTSETTINFNGARAQDIPALAYHNLTVSADGIKTLPGNATVEKQLTLTAGEIRTGNNKITLGTAAGSISETPAAYVTGIVETMRDVPAGVDQDFGGLGLKINPAVPAGFTRVTRTTGTAVGMIGNSVKRIFAVEPATNNGYLDATVSIAYFDHELNANEESDLALYRSENGIDNWHMFATERTTRNESLNIVAVTGFNKFSTVTLGSQYTPLPVEIVNFEAVKSGNKALIRWITTSESNNSGYNVQVSEDGYTFRTLGFVGSKPGNSSARQIYTYTDTETGKAGIRYYRLQQLDADGSPTYYGPRMLAFGAPAASPAISAYPNPFERELKVTVHAAKATVAKVQLHDSVGRLVFTKTAQVAQDLQALDLDMQAVRQAGIYILTIEIDGQVSHIKVVRQ